MLAQAYAATGREQEAAPLFEEVVLHSSAPETLYTYAAFLKSQNRRDEARDWLRQLQQKKQTLPRYLAAYRAPLVPQGGSAAKRVVGILRTGRQSGLTYTPY